MNSPQRPRPVVDALTAPFWQAVSNHQLVVQRCASCETWQHPPRIRCHCCGSTQALSYKEVTGYGRIVTWTRVYQSLIAGFEDSVPYFNVIVELDEQSGLCMVTDLQGDLLAFEAKLNVGAQMKVVFEEVATDFTLPQFRFLEGAE